MKSRSNCKPSILTTNGKIIFLTVKLMMCILEYQYTRVHPLYSLSLILFLRNQVLQVLNNTGFGYFCNVLIQILFTDLYFTLFNEQCITFIQLQAYTIYSHSKFNDTTNIFNRKKKKVLLNIMISWDQTYKSTVTRPNASLLSDKRM